MRCMEHVEKDFKTIRLCLTGSVITMYDNENGSVIVRYCMKNDREARERFFLQVSLLEKVA